MSHNHVSAVRYSDQYHCSHCGKQWDVNDSDPPDCKPLVKVLPIDSINNLRRVLNEPE
jgi:hypothetical protein